MDNKLKELLEGKISGKEFKEVVVSAGTKPEPLNLPDYIEITNGDILLCKDSGIILEKIENGYKTEFENDGNVIELFMIQVNEYSVVYFKLKKYEYIFSSFITFTEPFEWFNKLKSVKNNKSIIIAYKQDLLITLIPIGGLHQLEFFCKNKLTLPDKTCGTFIVEDTKLIQTMGDIRPREVARCRCGYHQYFSYFEFLKNKNSILCEYCHTMIEPVNISKLYNKSKK